MKYYEYISTEKLKMLYPQTKRGRISKLISRSNLEVSVGKFKVGANNLTEDTILSLKKTLNHLQKENLIGSLDDPREFVHGVLPFRTGIPIYEDCMEISRWIVDVALWGNVNRSIVLVGSRKHLVGEAINTVESGTNFSQLRQIIELIDLMQTKGISIER